MNLVTVAPGHFLAPAPAASYARARADGMPAGITSSYRSTDEQTKLRAKWEADPVNNPFASRPGQSKHELGRALDLWWEAQLWLRAHPEYGWRFTDPTEWWHAEYFLELDQRLGQGTSPAPLIPTTTPEDPMLILRNAATGLTAVILGDGTWALIQTAAAATSLRAAGLPSADVDPTTFDRICPGTRRRHSL